MEILERLQAEAMADDVAIDLARMSCWTELQAIEYFESGGTVKPDAQDTIWILCCFNAVRRRDRMLNIEHARNTSYRLHDCSKVSNDCDSSCVARITIYSPAAAGDARAKSCLWQLRCEEKDRMETVASIVQ